MRKLTLFYGFFILFLKSVQTLAGIETLSSGVNLTLFKGQREKRTLIYEGSGQLKFSIGPSMPVVLGDPITWRSLVCSYTLQGGHYGLPTEPLYPWDKYEDIFARSMRKSKSQNLLLKNGVTNLESAAAAEQYWTDDSRIFVYKLLEKLLNRQSHIQGRDCLLRSICENAQVQQHVGIFAEILNIILTPGKEKIDLAYVAAYEAGKTGADCLSLYKDCPMGSNILDEYLEYM